MVHPVLLFGSPATFFFFFSLRLVVFIDFIRRGTHLLASQREAMSFDVSSYPKWSHCGDYCFFSRFIFPNIKKKLPKICEI